MARPNDPGLQLFYDKVLYEAGGDVRAAEQELIEYACRRKKALARDNGNKAVGIPPDRFYKSRLQGLNSSSKCPVRNLAGLRCSRPLNHPSTEPHRF